jgi:hypothetical protein
LNLIKVFAIGIFMESYGKIRNNAREQAIVCGPAILMLLIADNHKEMHVQRAAQS